VIDIEVSAENIIAVACLDCVHCEGENVLGVVREKRTGFNSTAERVITCKHCHRSFTLRDYDIQLRYKSKEFLEAEYGYASLALID